MIAFLLLAAAASPTPAGHWTSPKGTITILIAPCPAAPRDWCGTVTGASDKAVADTARASGRDLVGMMLVRDMRPVGPGHWRGTIEVPDRRTSARGAIRLVGEGLLEVKGCGLGGLICKSQRWTRAD